MFPCLLKQVSDGEGPCPLSLSRCQTGMGHVPLSLKADVRRGGAMSPCLFAIFIDDIVIKFKTLGRFCNSEYVCTNIFLYADDIVFLSPSLCILQDMLYLCESELAALDMCINVK